MPKKPAATAASPTSDCLSPEAQAWFNSVEERYNLDDHHRKLLTAGRSCGIGPCGLAHDLSRPVCGT